MQNDFGGMVVSRISSLFEIGEVQASNQPGHFWIQQGQTMRLLDLRALQLKKELMLSPESLQKAPGHLKFHESDCNGSIVGPVWILLQKKYLYMNERFIGMLPFEIKGRIRKLVYQDSIIVILEDNDKFHTLEVNEFYNIINHQ